MLLQATEITKAPLDLFSQFTDIAIQYAPKLAGAILVYIIGSFIIGWISKAATTALNVKKVDASLQSFLTSMIKVVLNVLLL